MRLPTVVIAAVVACGVPLVSQSPPEMRDLVDALPASTTRVDQFAMTADGKRAYFVNSSGEAWLYDRTRQTSARVAPGPLWDLNLSPSGTALAYTKGGDKRGEQYVWSIALDPSTGSASGAERRLSAHQGDVPSISPDGKFVAFARDDDTGVGQTIVVVPITGGNERVVTAVPSSAANIRWTPDGKTLFIGVNPPVACVPEWSCLPLNQDLRQPPGTIRRVAVLGGEATIVTTTRGAAPGLSPDGTTLMFLDAGTTRKWVVANADGTPRETFVLAQADTPIGWLQPATVVIVANTGNRMRTMSFGGK